MCIFAETEGQGMVDEATNSLVGHDKKPCARANLNATLKRKVVRRLMHCLSHISSGFQKCSLTKPNIEVN
jgi:hypothetical protein